MDTRFVRYHPVFPTTQEAAADYNLVTSDHVPLIATIDDIIVLTWNVLQFDSGNGFASIENGLQYQESDEQKRARHARIVAAIKRFVDLHHPTFIALQEITDRDPALLDAILATLGEDWCCVHRDDGTQSRTGGVVTLARKSALQDLPIHEEIRNPIGTCSTRFTLANGKTGRLLNVHPMYSQIITNAEIGLVDYLLRHNNPHHQNEDDYCIVAGDFNAHIAPISDEPQSITTSVAAPFFRDQAKNPSAVGYSAARQGAAAVDGVFYSKREDGRDRYIVQADSQHLDPMSGQICTKEQLAPIPTADLHPGQQEELDLPRMVISVDHRHMERKAIDGKFTLLEYQAMLRQKYAANSILVRFARDLNNRAYIAIAYPNILLKQMKTAALRTLHENVLAPLGREYSYDDDYSKKPHRVVYIPQVALKLDANNLPIYTSPEPSSASTDDSSSDISSEDDDKQDGIFKRYWPVFAIVGTGIFIAAALVLSGGLSFPSIVAWPFIQHLASSMAFYSAAFTPEIVAGVFIGFTATVAGGIGALATWGLKSLIEFCLRPSSQRTKTDDSSTPHLSLLDFPRRSSISTQHSSRPGFVPKLNLSTHAAVSETIRVAPVNAHPLAGTTIIYPSSSESSLSEDVSSGTSSNRGQDSSALATTESDQKPIATIVPLEQDELASTLRNSPKT